MAAPLTRSLLDKFEQISEAASGHSGHVIAVRSSSENEDVAWQTHSMKPDNPTWIACGTTRCPRWRDENCKHDAGEAQFVRSKPAGVGNRQRRVVVIARITPFDSSGSISVTATTGTLLTPRIKSRTIGQPPVDANRPVCAISNAGDHQQEQLVPPTEPSESHRRIQRCTARPTPNRPFVVRRFIR